uniref:Testis expressed 50 n=1 Tax=Pelusios castaneus TaxID=367368 RepID=A0A8C8R9N4_9SAUR
MFSQGFSLVFPIWIVVLFQDSLCLCDRPSWARVGWEILPEDLEQLKLGIQLHSSCLPYPLDQVSHYFTILEISKGCLKVLYGSCTLILFLCCSVTSLSGFVRKSVRLYKPSRSQSLTPFLHLMLCRLVANTSVMMEYLKHICHHHGKEARHQKLSKKRKTEEIEDEEIFPIYPQLV